MERGREKKEEKNEKNERGVTQCLEKSKEFSPNLGLKEYDNGNKEKVVSFKQFCLSVNGSGRGMAHP